MSTNMRPNVNGLYVVWYIDLSYSIVNMAVTLARYENNRWYHNNRDKWCPFMQAVIFYEGPVRQREIPKEHGRRPIPLDDYSDVE